MGSHPCPRHGAARGHYYTPASLDTSPGAACVLACPLWWRPAGEGSHELASADGFACRLLVDRAKRAAGHVTAEFAGSGGEEDELGVVCVGGRGEEKGVLGVD
nr:unnamed protein product [Digitaria exilis]